MDRCVLLVGVGLINYKISNHKHMRERTNSRCSTVADSKRSYFRGSEVIGVIHASPFSPLMFIEQDPQIPSLQELQLRVITGSYRRNVNVGSIVSLI